MDLKTLVQKNRSYRRFNEERKIRKGELVDLVELARNSASAANKQPLKFMISYERENNEKIYPAIAWAGYLKDWKGPVEGERPSGYIIILGDHDISSNFFVDHGIQAQTMLLGAVEKGLGGCMIAAFNKEVIKEIYSLPDNLEPLLIIAIGEPAEKVVIEKVIDKDIRYYRDEDNTHHVPKRSLDEILL